MHNHITYDEIKRYVNVDEDIFSSDNADFFDSFEEKLDKCSVCEKRFDAFFVGEAFTSAIMEGLEMEAASQASEFEMLPVKAKNLRAYSLLSPITEDETLGETACGLIEQFKDYVSEMGELIRSSLKIEPWSEPELTWGLLGAKTLSQSAYKDEKSGDNEEDVAVISKKQNEEFSEFELFKQTKIRIDIQQKPNDECKYELYIWRVEDEKEFSYTMEKALNGELYAKTEVLDAGLYLAGVVVKRIV
jgi:hypothetical protein